MRPVQIALLVVVMAAGAALGAGEALAPRPATIEDDPVARAALMERRPPRLLSETGLFIDIAAQEPAPGVVPYDLAIPLFSDHSVKSRFASLPPGTSANVVPRDVLAFPVGTILVKSFSMPDVVGQTEPARLLETRLLVHAETGWRAWTYLHDGAGDAQLAITGATIPVETMLNGAPLAFDYEVPTVGQCRTCHVRSGEITPIGPSLRNLAHDRSGEDQLAIWQRMELVDGLPADHATVPRIEDEAASVTARARGWLDINCAHCHHPQGSASNSGLYLGWFVEDAVALGIGKRPVAAGRGSFGLMHDVVPGDPEASILYARVASTQAGVMMPELGRSLFDAEGAALVRAWIEGLDD